MAEEIRFHFDPICPWCWITSVWVRQLERLGEVQVDWALFSLELINEAREDLAHKRHGRSALGLRTAMAVRDDAGSAGVGRFYAALGTRVHERGESLEDAATVHDALTDAGLDPALAERAGADAAFWTRVTEEHTRLVERTRSFGVPTIVLDGGDGPAIFGPVIGAPPSDEDAVSLWRHVSWLTRYDNFSELKRERTVVPDHLASWSS